MQRHFRLGGVAHKPTCLRGQGLIEYVLIAAVIGLVVVFAGPQVSGAIRNQFNQVTSMVDAGTDGTVVGGESGGGSAGAESAAVQAAVAKDAKNWTLDDQKAVAEDIAAKGESSPAYAKAKATMEMGTKFSVKLTNGRWMTYRIVGINHDGLADGSGKAGLTFEATNDVMGMQRMNATSANAGGWDKSELRGRLNSGDLWALLPAEIQSKTRAVTKMTDNKDGGSAGTPSATTDKVFLVSMTEIYGSLQSDGSQYEYFKFKNAPEWPEFGGPMSFDYWTRSASPSDSTSFRNVRAEGSWDDVDAVSTEYVFPAWCF